MNSKTIGRAAGICLATAMTVVGGSSAVANTRGEVSAPVSVRATAPSAPAAEAAGLTPEARFLILMTILKGLNKS